MLLGGNVRSADPSVTASFFTFRAQDIDFDQHGRVTNLPPGAFEMQLEKLRQFVNAEQ